MFSIIVFLAKIQSSSFDYLGLMILDKFLKDGMHYVDIGSSELIRFWAGQYGCDKNRWRRQRHQFCNPMKILIDDLTAIRTQIRDLSSYYEASRPNSLKFNCLFLMWFLWRSDFRTDFW